MTAKCCYRGLSSRGRRRRRGARLFQSTVEVVRSSEVAVHLTGNLSQRATTN